MLRKQYRKLRRSVKQKTKNTPISNVFSIMIGSENQNPNRKPGKARKHFLKIYVLAFFVLGFLSVLGVLFLLRVEETRVETVTCLTNSDSTILETTTLLVTTSTENHDNLTETEMPKYKFDDSYTVSDEDYFNGDFNATESTIE